MVDIKNVWSLFFIFIGSLFAAFSLEVFLIPNHIIDGGVTGVSIILSHLFPIPFGALLMALNAPFWLIGRKTLGRRFLLLSMSAVFVIAILSSFFVPHFILTHDLLLSAVFGGMLMGFGVGLVIRFGGATDGVEILGIIIDRKSVFTVGQIAMIINFFILSSAGFVFGWTHALYSIMAYYISTKVIDFVLEGLDESRSVFIISNQHEEIGNAIITQLHRGVTYLDGEGGFTRQRKKVIYSVISRLEESQIKDLVTKIDPKAFMTFNIAHDVKGGRFKKKGFFSHFTKT